METRIVKKISVFVLFFTFLFSCENNHYYQDYVDLSDGWSKDSSKVFTFHVADAKNLKTDLAFLLRNETDYEYSNLYLFTNIKDPKGIEMNDTLQYYIANPDGSWIGKGFSSKEQLLIIRENLELKDTGTYTVKVWQGMRTKNLKGLKDISLIVDKIND